MRQVLESCGPEVSRRQDEAGGKVVGESDVGRSGVGEIRRSGVQEMNIGWVVQRALRVLRRTVWAILLG